MTLRPLPMLLALAAALLTGWLTAGSMSTLAHAADVPPMEGLRCRPFKTPLDGEAQLDTTDATSEVGQWVAEQGRDGWLVHDIDLEVAQKPNGFPMGIAHVCLARR